MGCGCAYTAEEKTRRNERVAMCLACPERLGWTECTISGRKCREHIESGVCPIGSFPGADGKTEWIGLTHRGVPKLIRVGCQMARPILGKRMPDLPGCGCIHGLKSLYQAIRLRISSGSNSTVDGGLTISSPQG